MSAFPRAQGVAALNIAVVGAALALGALAIVSPPAALALPAALAAAWALAVHPRLFVPLMIASVFFGALAVGGLPVGRLVGPIALPVAMVAIVRRGGVELRGSALPFWIAAYSAFAFASLYWTKHSGGTVGMLISLALAIVYALAIAVLTRTREDLRYALVAFTVAAIGLFGLGFLAVAGGADAETTLALIGDRNFAAAFLMVGLPPSLVLFFAPARPWERPVGAIGAVCAVLGIVGTGSQGGMLALLCVLLAGALIGPRPRLRRKLAPILVPAVPLALALTLTILASGGQGTEGADLRSSIERSSVDRLNLWRGAMTAYRERPLTGIGYGAYAEYSAHYMLETPGVNLRLYNLPEKPQEAHNTYVEGLAELGPLGLGLFLAMVVTCLLTLARLLGAARRRADREMERFALAMILSVTGFAVASFFLSVATNRGWWVIFGLTIAAARLDYDERRENNSGSDRAAVSGREIFTR